MVVDDVIKPTFAIETIEAHGDRALAVLQEALARKTGGADEVPADAGSADTDAEEAPAPKKVRLAAKDMACSFHSEIACHSNVIDFVYTLSVLVKPPN